VECMKIVEAARDMRDMRDLRGIVVQHLHPCIPVWYRCVFCIRIIP
jgi:hypothetical protein